VAEVEAATIPSINNHRPVTSRALATAAGLPGGFSCPAHLVESLMGVALPRGEREPNTDKQLAEDLGKSGCIEFQSVSGTDPKLKFEPLHSIYATWVGNISGCDAGDVSDQRWSPVDTHCKGYGRARLDGSSRARSHAWWVQGAGCEGPARRLVVAPCPIAKPTDEQPSRGQCCADQPSADGHGREDRRPMAAHRKGEAAPARKRGAEVSWRR